MNGGGGGGSGGGSGGSGGAAADVGGCSAAIGANVDVVGKRQMMVVVCMNGNANGVGIGCVGNDNGGWRKINRPKQVIDTYICYV